MKNNFGRRDFLKTTAATALGASLFKWATPAVSLAEADLLNKWSIPKRRLGRTGYQVSIISLGGQSTIERSGKRDEAVAIINRALDRGINYIDTAESYGNGISETYIGEVMKDRRDEVFLATKTRLRTMHGIEHDRFEKSCERLQTDFIDLYFMHFVNSVRDLDTLLDRDEGAILAFERLKEKGRIGNIGISSHSVAVLEEALERYDFDCIFLTINPARLSMSQTPKETRAFLSKVAEKDVGVIAMKLTGRNHIFDRDISMKQTMEYALSAGRSKSTFPIATAAIGITTIDQIDENVQLAGTYEPCSEAKLDRMESRADGTLLKVNLISPSQGEEVSKQFVFAWQEVEDAVTYQLQIARSDFNDTVPDTTVTENEFKCSHQCYDKLEPGASYTWRVRVVEASLDSWSDDEAGSWSDERSFRVEKTTSAENGKDIPSEFKLSQNYPNPFNPVTNIGYSLPAEAYVTLKVYNLTGREVAVLVNTNQKAGHHNVTFDSRSMSSGIYLYRLQAIPAEGTGYQKFEQTRRMTLIK